MPAYGPAMHSIRLLIADDHQPFRQTLRQLVESEGGFEVVGEACDGRQAVELARQLKPDIVLMDVQMPVLDGVQAAGLITDDNPQARVIVLTMHRHDAYLFEAIKAGAQAFLLKDTDEQTLFDAIRDVHRGKALLGPQLTARLLDEFRSLSQAGTYRSRGQGDE